jgi:hypothetical protein
MLRKVLLALLVVVTALSLTVVPLQVAGAQEPPGSGAPAPDIVPQPNSGHEPTEAGDRGGALQLLILGLVVVGVGGVVVHLTRQARRARDQR